MQAAKLEELKAAAQAANDEAAAAAAEAGEEAPAPAPEPVLEEPPVDVEAEVLKATDAVAKVVPKQVRGGA